mgnify:CR=1 FL=1
MRGSTTIFRGQRQQHGLQSEPQRRHRADGSGSAKVDYTLTETGASQGAYTAEWRASKSTGIDCSTYTALHLWVYGDGSGNILSLLYNDGAAGYQSLQVTPLDFTGWKQVTVTLPGAHFEIQGLQVSATTAADGTVSVGDKLSGTIYIDHITATASGTPDNAAPVVSASLDNSLWQVTASVATRWMASCRRAASPSPTTAPPTAAMIRHRSCDRGPARPRGEPRGHADHHHRPGPLRQHRPGLRGCGAYGVDHKFTDINDYWAATYVDFLYNANITTATPTAPSGPTTTSPASSSR